jgi:hypothetical protein
MNGDEVKTAVTFLKFYLGIHLERLRKITKDVSQEDQ